jgi:RimJ/RimL family protein N-acetyltransferase
MPVVLRRARPSDLDGVAALIAPDAATALTAAGFRSLLADGQYRAEWIWIAEGIHGGPGPLAAAIWWGPSNGATPRALDALYVREPVEDAEDDAADSDAADEDAARIGLAAELLSAAHRSFAAEYDLAAPPSYGAFVPGDWHDRPEVLKALTWRRKAAERAGLGVLLERLHYEWTPRAGLPKPGDRLTFRREPDDEVFADVLARVVRGSLDKHSTQQAAELGPEAYARADVAFYRDRMLGERGWWLIATDRDGETVGFGIPSRNPKHAVVGYLGVVPEQRGHGYIDEILAEITRILATEAGADAIRADTDLANRPMAAAFERAGYRNIARRLVFSGR